MSTSEISKLMDDETFMTASEALENGFVDEIIDIDEDDQPSNVVSFGSLEVPESVYRSVMMINDDCHCQIIKPVSEFSVFGRTVEKSDTGKEFDVLWGADSKTMIFEPQSILYSSQEWSSGDAKMLSSSIHNGTGSQTPIFPGMNIGDFKKAKKTNKLRDIPTNLTVEDFMKYRFDREKGLFGIDANGNEKLVMTLEECVAQGMDVTKAPSASDIEHIEAIATAKAMAHNSGIMEERKRVAGITAAIATMDVAEELKIELIGDGTEAHPGLSLSDANMRIVAEMGKGLVTVKSPDLHTATGSAVGADERDKKMSGMVNALLVKSGVEKTPEKINEARSSEYGGFGLQGFVRECLSIDGLGDSAFRLSSHDLLGAFKESLYGGSRYAPKMSFSMNTSTLQSVLNTNANSAMLKTLEEQRHSFQTLVKEDDLGNVKTSELYTTTNAPDVLEIPEGAAPKLSKFSDKKESTKLKKFGRAWSLTDEMIINDELKALTDLPSKYAKAMLREQNSDFYSQLLTGTGPTLVNGGNFFQSVTGHNNLVTPGGALNKVALRTAYKNFLKFTLGSPDGGRSNAQYANITPRYLVTGPDNADLAADFTTNRTDPDTGVNDPTKNLFGPGQMWSLQPVTDAQFLTHDANAWMLIADPMDHDIAMLYTLLGQRVPKIDSAVARAGEAKGITFDIVHYWVIKFLDWRGFSKNDGGV